MVDVHQRFLHFLDTRRNLGHEQALPDDEEIEAQARARRPHRDPRSPPCSRTARSTCTRRCSSRTTRGPVPVAELERAYFPAPLPERFGEQMRAHRLGR